VAFHSTAGGEYQLCFSTNSSRWVADGSPMKFVRGAQGAMRWRGEGGAHSPAAHTHNTHTPHTQPNHARLPRHSPLTPPCSAWT
jgi:hypothetical protein